MGWRWGNKEAGPCFTGLYLGRGDTAVSVGHGDKVSGCPYSNRSAELEGGESSGILLCIVLTWRGRRKLTSSFTRRNQWAKGDNSFSGLFAAYLLVWFSPF